MAVKAKYKCTRVELYAIFKLALSNLGEDRTDFVAKKTIYTAGHLTDLGNIRKDTMALPGEAETAELHENLEGLLPALKNTCVDNFSSLQSFIRSAWPGADAKPRYNAAGWEDEKLIGSNNWESVVAMNEKMITFISNVDNAAKLATPGGMPAGFAGQVSDDAEAFNEVYDPFLVARETTAARDKKVKAENLMYATFMDGFMMDGTDVVYKREDGKKKRYVFDSLKNFVSPPGSASLKVKVKKADDTPVADKIVKIKKEGSVALTAVLDAEGIALFDKADPGRYDGEVDMGDGVIVNFVKEIDTGVDARITVMV